MHCNSLWIKMTVRCIHAGVIFRGIFQPYFCSDGMHFPFLTVDADVSFPTDILKHALQILPSGIILFYHFRSNDHKAWDEIIYSWRNTVTQSLFLEIKTDLHFSLYYRFHFQHYKQPSETCTTLRIRYYQLIGKEGVQNVWNGFKYVQNA